MPAASQRSKSKDRTSQKNSTSGKGASSKRESGASSKTRVLRERNVHCDKGAYVAGEWVDMEDIGERFNVKGGSHGKCGGNCSTCPRSRSRNSAERPGPRGGYDVVVIGAGCIGSAISRELSKTTASVLLLEAADDVTQGATKGNSGIVHAGYDDKPGTVKSKYCWRGNQMFPKLDEELHFGFQKNGSMVVAKSQEDLSTLDMLMERGRINGVKNCRILNQEELRQKEPFIHEDAIAALYSPDAGTITPYEYTIALAENAVDNGVELRVRREVVAIEQVEKSENSTSANNGRSSDGETPRGRFKLTIKYWEPEDVARRLNREMGHGSMLTGANLAACALSVVGAAVAASAQTETEGGSMIPFLCGLTLMLTSIGYLISKRLLNRSMDGKPGGGLFERWSYSPSKGTVLEGLAKNETVWCDFIVNAAGCKSDEIARMVGDNSFQIKPRMGEYILLHKNEGVRLNTSHTLFPCPHPVYGKGVLVQGTLWGNLILGPTARDTMRKNKSSGKYEIDPDVRDEPRDNIMGYILSKCRNLIPDFDASQVIHTFSGARAKNTTGDWIIGPVAGVAGFINAASIDSPGIAASPAIAEDVVRMLGEAGLKSGRDPTFNPVRAPIVVPKDGYKGIRMSKNDFWKVKDPRQNVVCKCERVTEQEVIDACHRSLPIDSTQAIRKRTRAGMGHCQGDPNNYNCEARVAQIISRETGIPLNEVGRRPWPASSMLKQRHVYIDESEKEHLSRLSKPGQVFKLHGAA